MGYIVSPIRDEDSNRKWRVRQADSKEHTITDFVVARGISLVGATGIEQSFGCGIVAHALQVITTSAVDVHAEVLSQKLERLQFWGSAFYNHLDVSYTELHTLVLLPDGSIYGSPTDPGINWDEHSSDSPTTEIDVESLLAEVNSIHAQALDTHFADPAARDLVCRMANALSITVQALMPATKA